MYCIGRVLNPNEKINSHSDGRIHSNSPKNNLKCRGLQRQLTLPLFDIFPL
uniref:Uncharacterized protein n=1 Tax=Utricularia reniformis TaxID=192314 RepID=A0A1Y0B1V6_9LAMI|nr:hypothetical protein AEK19_MT1222 [Utricularia reniformis]ART31435.1 hypothetical protein AEK19_MT1222 [Utricularia reniformis]